MAIIAPAGIVITQLIAMSRTVVKFKAPIPLASPTPKTAPTSVCVVDMGRASFEAITIVVAAPNSAQKPLEGVSSVIRFPTVSITLHPYIARPITMPPPPRANAQRGSDAFAATTPS